MKKLTKLSAAIMCCIICVSAMTPAYAFYGYSHWDIARRVAVENSIPTANNQRLIYQSGTLAADLGKAIGWDDEYGKKSDGNTFANKIIELADSQNEKWFAAGWRDHYRQDTLGDISNIPSTHSNYTLKCGWLDEYLRDTRNISCPINGTANLFLSYGLIRETYNDLCDFSPSDSQINNAISDMYSAYNTAILLNVYGMNSQEIAAMDSEFNRVAALCGGTNLRSIAFGLELENNIDDVYDYEGIIAEISSNDKKERASSIMNDMREVAVLQVVDTHGEFTELNYCVLNQEKYDELLLEMCALVVEE